MADSDKELSTTPALRKMEWAHFTFKCGAERPD